MARLRVRVSPGAAADRVTGRKGDEIAVSLTAPPVDGRANRALLRFLAKALDVRAGDMEIATGLSARSKTVSIEGMDGEEAAARLLALCPGAVPAPTAGGAAPAGGKAGWPGRAGDGGGGDPPSRGRGVARRR
ncbi:MAG: DUF167 domain-containing protein [Deltaproteobacteria bacterium]|nr:DUF167 domain-containing protein [Deltaproteobacteria bacterium]